VSTLCAALRFVSGPLIALGLIVQQLVLLALVNGLSIEGDLVALDIHPMVRRLDDAAIHAHAAGADPASRFRPRAESCFGQRAVQGLQCFLQSYSLTVL